MNSNTNLTVATIDTMIQEVYANNVLNWLFLSSTILPFYAALLKLSQEIEHIWFRSFSLPTLLYIFARYGTLAQQGLRWSVILVPLGKACNILEQVTNCVQILPYIGVQGLLVARAYTLCSGKIPTMALALAFLSSLIFELYGVITIPVSGCISTNLSNKDILIALGSNICVISTDVLIFGICMWKVWGTGKLQREVGIQTRHSLVSVLIEQSILRCCFVVVITITGAVLISVKNPSVPFQDSSQNFLSFQNALSSILVSDSTLDLRNLNSAEIQASRASLPPLQFSNVLQHVHQSFVVELATPGSLSVEGSGDCEHDNSGSMEDIQPAQD